MVSEGTLPADTSSTNPGRSHSPTFQSERPALYSRSETGLFFVRNLRTGRSCPVTLVPFLDSQRSLERSSLASWKTSPRSQYVFAMIATEQWVHAAIRQADRTPPAPQ